MRRLQLRDPADHRPRRGHELEGQVFVKGHGIDPLPQRGVAQQRLELRCEQQASALDRVVERLDAHSVPRQQKPAKPQVQHREREHAVEVLDHVLAPFLIGMDQGLGVRLGDKGVAGRDQAIAQLWKVVDLAVLDHPDGGVFVVDRLMPTLEVDDRKAARAERHTAGVLDPLIVRPPVGHRPAHRADELPAARGIAACDSADPAHAGVRPES